jgi:hypothetical protein
MSIFWNHIECPQCGRVIADHEFNCRNSGEVTACRRWWYEENWEPTYGSNGSHCGCRHDISTGLGALSYRSVGAPAFVAHSLNYARP